MPDGDIVHPSLFHPYKQPYTTLCEGQSNNDRIVDTLIRASKERVRRHDTAVVAIINSVVEVLNQAQNGPLFNAGIDWSQMCDEVTKAVQRQNRELKADRRIVALIESAAKHQLVEQRNGIQTDNLPVAVAQKFLRSLYSAEFEEKVPMTDAHPNGIDHTKMLNKLACLHPQIDGRLDDMAAYLIEKGTVKGLKCQRPQQERSSVSIDTALDDIGR